MVRSDNKRAPSEAWGRREAAGASSLQARRKPRERPGRRGEAAPAGVPLLWSPEGPSLHRRDPNLLGPDWSVSHFSIGRCGAALIGQDRYRRGIAAKYQLDGTGLQPLVKSQKYQEGPRKGWPRGQEPPGSLCLSPEMQCARGLQGLGQQRRSTLLVNCSQLTAGSPSW